MIDGIADHRHHRYLCLPRPQASKDAACISTASTQSAAHRRNMAETRFGCVDRRRGNSKSRHTRVATPEQIINQRGLSGPNINDLRGTSAAGADDTN